MSKKKCLIIDPMHPSVFELLQGEEVILDYRPEIKKDEVLNIIHDFFGVFVRSKMFMGKEFFDKAVNLKFIARAGAGLDLIDLQEAEDRGILLFNASEGNADAVGEHVIGMLLALMNKMRTGDAEVRQKIWKREENRGYEIFGKTVGIVGYGFMGKAVAKRLSSFGCRILAYDKFVKNFKEPWAKEVSLNQLREESDIVTFHIPLTTDNRGLVDFDYINKFRKNIWLINAARGEILNTAHLIENLKSGKVLGAGLDVLENEKLDTLTELQKVNFDFLASADNVLLTPHVGGWTFESYQKINEVLAAKIKNSNILYNF